MDKPKPDWVYYTSIAHLLSHEGADSECYLYHVTAHKTGGGSQTYWVAASEQVEEGVLNYRDTHYHIRPPMIRELVQNAFAIAADPDWRDTFENLYKRLMG